MSEGKNTLEKKRCKYPGCGSILHQGHHSDYCYVHEKSVMAQEEKGAGNDMSDTDGNIGLLSVEQLVGILPYSERTIRDMLQDGRIIGTRFGARGKWFVMKSEVERFQEHGARSYDLEQMTEVDKETFRKSDKIMAEADLIYILSCLEHDNYYKIDDYRKLFKFMHYFYRESNSYITPELQRLCSKLWKVLEALLISLKIDFVEGKKTWLFRSDKYQLAGYEDNFDENTAKEYSNTERQLKEHVLKARKAYGEYRQAIKRILCL